MEKMQLIFFVPPNEELEGTLHPQKFGCTPKNEGKRVHVPPDEKTCGHADLHSYQIFFLYTSNVTINHAHNHIHSGTWALIDVFVFSQSLFCITMHTSTCMI
jgi:hypothetical protein